MAYLAEEVNLQFLKYFFEKLQNFGNFGPEGLLLQDEGRLLPLHRRVHGGRGQGRCCEQRARGVQPGHGGRDDGLGGDARDPFGAGAELLGVPLRGELEKWLRSWLSGFHVHVTSRLIYFFYGCYCQAFE